MRMIGIILSIDINNFVEVVVTCNVKPKIDRYHRLRRGLIRH